MIVIWFAYETVADKQLISTIKLQLTILLTLLTIDRDKVLDRFGPKPSIANP